MTIPHRRVRGHSLLRSVDRNIIGVVREYSPGRNVVHVGFSPTTNGFAQQQQQTAFVSDRRASRRDRGSLRNDRRRHERRRAEIGRRGHLSRSDVPPKGYQLVRKQQRTMGYRGNQRSREVHPPRRHHRHRSHGQRQGARAFEREGGLHATDGGIGIYQDRVRGGQVRNEGPRGCAGSSGCHHEGRRGWRLLRGGTRKVGQRSGNIPTVGRVRTGADGRERAEGIGIRAGRFGSSMFVLQRGMADEDRTREVATEQTLPPPPR
mmetsp:Transcript_32246/g.78042  ORF Transcript_32246/g.78042 Transcript_32246/m.78042 type:complete len:263 (+) Transcript_32246:149-937(+)